MTTTLVRSPEREAHIARLMEQTIEIKIPHPFPEEMTNDDGLLTIASVSLWDAMDDIEQEVFLGDINSLKYVGIGQCNGYNGCNEISYHYKAIIGIHYATPVTGAVHCVQCMSRDLFRNKFESMRELVFTNISRYDLPDLLSIESIFPPATDEGVSCNRCNRLLPPDGMDVGSWQSITSAWINEEEIVYMHRRCTYKCPGCNEAWSLSTKYEDIDSSSYCTPCFNKYTDDNEITDCDYGSHYTLSELIYSDVRDEAMCRSCYDNYIECGDCGYEYQEDNGHECENDDDTSDYSEYIHNYSYRPRPLFFPDANHPYYLGIELEVEVCGDESRNDCAEMIVEGLSNRVYLKEDGSLSNGFEIVTHPHTLLEYQTNVDWGFLKVLSKMGVRSWNRSSCGLHVHVSRTAFQGNTYAASEAHKVRFNKLIYDNQRQVERIAGRKNNSYATFNDKGKVIRKVKYHTQSNGRYSAVNMEPEDTLEVRVFKGSLRKERVLSGIEFVVAAVEYTRNLKIEHKAAPFAWARFVHYVTANSDTYPNLFIIMNETFDKDNDPNGDN